MSFCKFIIKFLSLIDVKIMFLLDILRIDGQNLIQFYTYIIFVSLLVFLLVNLVLRFITEFAVTANLISAFVFATRIIQFLYFLNPKFQASSLSLCLYSSVCVGPFRNQMFWFSHAQAQIQGICCSPSNL